MKVARSTASSNGQRRFLLFRPDDWRVSEPASRGEVVDTWADIFLRTGLMAAASIGWLGLALAQVGRFTLANLLTLTGLGTAGLLIGWVMGRRALPRLPGLTWHDVAVGALLVLAARLYTPPADYAPAILDAGWYTDTGALIRRTGALTTRPDVFAALSHEQRSLFVWSYRDARRILPQFPAVAEVGFYDVAFATDLADGGLVGPFHPPGFSVWVAILDALGGPRFGGYAAPLFGLLFVLAVYGAARAAFGALVGLTAAFLLAVSPPVVYYSRTPFAEVAAGALIWGGVYALTRFAHHNRRSDAALAGLAFGAALLTKIEGLLLIIPLVLLLISPPRSALRSRPTAAGWWLVPFGVLATHAGLLAATVLRPYVLLNGHGVLSGLLAVAQRPVAWLLLAGLAMGGIILVRLHWHAGVRTALALGVTVSGVMAVLPQTEVVSLLPALSQVVLFLTPLGVGLAVLGTVHLIRTGLPRSARVFVVVAAAMGLITLVAPTVTQTVSPLYAIRRQVPVVIPALCVLAACAALRWGGLSLQPDEGPTPGLSHPPGLVEGDARGAADEHGSRVVRRSSLRLRSGQALVFGRWVRCALALGVFFVLLTVLYGIDRSLPVRELAGSSAFTARLAAHFEPGDVLLFEGLDRGTHVGRFAAPLWARYGLQALVLSTTPPPADLLAAVVEDWSLEGDAVFLVSQSHPPPFDLPGYRWDLISRMEWIGQTAAATGAFPPESRTLRVPFYIYRVSRITIASRP